MKSWRCDKIPRKYSVYFSHKRKNRGSIYFIRTKVCNNLLVLFSSAHFDQPVGVYIIEMTFDKPFILGEILMLRVQDV